MSRSLYLLLALPALAGAATTVLCSLGSDPASYSAYVDRGPSADGGELAMKVAAALRPVCDPACPDFRLIRNATTPQAMFIVDGNVRSLVYKPEFFNAVFEAYGDAGILAIMAHEYGHAVDQSAPPAWLRKEWAPELRADALSSCALAKLNLSPRALGAGLKALAKYPSPAHPGWAARVPVLRAGYTQCGGDRNTFDKGAVLGAGA